MVHRLSSVVLAFACCACTVTPAATPLPRMIGELRPELMAVEPARARPGDAIAIRWAADTVRGVAYRLGRTGSDREWTVEYFLSIGANEPGSWHRSGDNVEIPAMAITDRGPDLLRIPDDAEPGAYRLCTLDDPGICAAIEVVAETSGWVGSLP